MNTKILNAEEIRGMDPLRRKEVILDTRKKMLDINMDIYTPRHQHAADLKALRKNLARILTVANEIKKSN